MSSRRALTAVAALSTLLVIGCSAGSSGPSATQTPTQSASPSASEVASSGGTRLIADGVRMPIQVTPLAPPSPYSYLGKVIGWTATFGMPSTSVDRNLTDFGHTLTEAGWKVGLDLSNNTVYAVRHVSGSWQVISTNVDCPAEANGACLMVVLFVHRPG